MSSLRDLLIDGLIRNNLKACNIIINSEYLMYHGKQVFCEVVRNDSQRDLNFFIRKGKSEGLHESREFIPNEYNVLKAQVVSNSLFGMTLPIVLEQDRYVVKVVSSLGLIMIESQLYTIARDIAETQIKKRRNGETLNYNSIVLNTTEDITPQEIGRFMDNFWEVSRIAYRNLVYRDSRGNVSRYVRRLYKLHEFYKIMDAFIPVFIDCSLFFNPMQDVSITSSEMYRMAVEKNRVIVDENSNYTLTAYFMSQEEICKAFKMHHFMRFNPQLWYDIFMGLLFSEDNAFPSISKKVMRGPQSVSAYGVPRVMSFKDFQNKIDTANSAMIFSAPVKFGGIETPADEFIKMLESYHEVDSLWLECESFYNAITRSGAHVLDDKDKISVDYIYQIMLEARL